MAASFPLSRAHRALGETRGTHRVPWNDVILLRYRQADQRSRAANLHFLQQVPGSSLTYPSPSSGTWNCVPMSSNASAMALSLSETARRWLTDSTGYSQHHGGEQRMVSSAVMLLVWLG